MIKLGQDVDGCLVDFAKGFAELLCHMTGKKIPPDFIPKSWYWWGDYGITKDEAAKAWEYVETHPEFWANLPALPNAQKDLEILHSLERGNDEVYFITNRPGIGAKRATELWLSNHGIANPTVLIASDKGPVARSLKLTHFIDDLPNNCESVLRHCGIRTKCFLFSAPYNEHFKDPYVPTITSIQDALKRDKSH